MNHYSEQELDIKIQTFMMRKTQQYPELMKTKKAKSDSTRSRFAITRFLPTITTYKPQLLR